MKTLIEVLKLAASYLEEHGVESARLNAERMLAQVLGIGRLELYLQFDRPLQDAELDRYRELTRRRAAGEPLQYLLGKSEFRELTLLVGPGVLVPRPETEQLVSLVLERLDTLQSRRSDTIKILDLCSGSGAVGLSLAAEREGLLCVMAKLTGPASAWAGRNQRELSSRLKSPAVLVRCDLLAAISRDKKFDLIVANPPYVKAGDVPNLRAEVREHEPAEALGAGPGGLDVIERIISEAAGYLKSGGMLAMEIGETMQADIENLFEKHAPILFGKPAFHPDLAGRTRFVTADKN